MDDNLIERAGSLKRQKTKKAAAAAAPDEDRRHKHLELVKLFGTVDFKPNWDYKAARQRGRLRTILLAPS